jgi:hypothetical protein
VNDPGKVWWFGATILCFGATYAVVADAQIQSGGTPSYRVVAATALGISPEDVVALPGTKWLIAGATPGSTSGGRGGLSVIDTTNPATILPLYPASSASDDLDKTRFKDCSGPPTGGLGPHGINVERLSDGSYNLVSVNHRGRESIEIFHLALDGGIPRVTWRGCAVLPASASGNSVAPLPNGGGYVVTNFLQKNDPHYLLEMENGTATGNVLKWTPDAGWSDLLGLKFSGANGAEITPDGKWIFISEWSDYKIWKFPMEGDASPQSIHLNFLPDNLRLTDKGTILIAGQNADPINVMTCRSKHVACQAPFTVLEMDPATMITHVLVQGGDDNFGGATGAAMVGSSLWISSYYSGKVVQYRPR